jgi:hypothetical protein
MVVLSRYVFCWYETLYSVAAAGAAAERLYQ